MRCLGSCTRVVSSIWTANCAGRYAPRLLIQMITHDMVRQRFFIHCWPDTHLILAVKRESNLQTLIVIVVIVELCIILSRPWIVGAIVNATLRGAEAPGRHFTLARERTTPKWFRPVPVKLLLVPESRPRSCPLRGPRK